MYKPGQRCFNSVVELFGKEILTPDGQIDRKALGNIVFNDKVNEIIFIGFTEKVKLTVAISNDLKIP